MNTETKKNITLFSKLDRFVKGAAQPTAGLMITLSLLSGCSRQEIGATVNEKAKTGEVLTVLQGNPTATVEIDQDNLTNSTTDSTNTTNADSTSTDSTGAGDSVSTVAGAPEVNKGYFDYDSSVVKSDTEEVIRSFGQWMLANPSSKLVVEGHADERGTREYNLALGARRANATKRYLVAMGIAPSRIRTISYGKERPDDPRSNEEAWAKNRRFVALRLQ